jgi:hypothetical protein
MKIIRIENCLGCPNRLFNYEETTSKIRDWWCRIDNERHEIHLEDKEIPSWCPLEDYRKVKNDLIEKINEALEWLNKAQLGASNGAKAYQASIILGNVKKLLEVKE